MDLEILTPAGVASADHGATVVAYFPVLLNQAKNNTLTPSDPRTFALVPGLGDQGYETQVKLPAGNTVDGVAWMQAGDIFSLTASTTGDVNLGEASVLGLARTLSTQL